MTGSGIQKYWLVPVVAICAIGVATMVAVSTWAPASAVVGTCVGLGLIGAAFLWAYATDREGRWWAVIPGLSMFTVVAAIVVDLLVGTDPGNDWASVIAVGAGVAVIGVVLKRADAKMVLYVVAAITVGVGVLMSPVSVAIKAVLIAADVAASAIVVYRANRGRPMISSHGWLHPHT